VSDAEVSDAEEDNGSSTTFLDNFLLALAHWKPMNIKVTTRILKGVAYKGKVSTSD
jgi:hypothetical protein